MAEESRLSIPGRDERGGVRALFDLAGKTAMITGATGYLGAAMASALAEAGASVIVSSRRLADARSVAEGMPQSRSQASQSHPAHQAAQGHQSVQVHHAVEMDQMDEPSIRRGFDAALAAAGRIDILVNNGHEPLGADWTTVTAEQFNRQLSNATGYFLLARMLHEHAVARGGGARIIMVGSMYGIVGSYPDAYAGVGPASPVAYHALKGGIVHMTRHLAVYWAKDGVRVNCLSPGPFPSDKASAEMVDRLKRKSPMGRMGRPEELKGAVVFLAADASSYMTGQNLVIDGGWTAW